MNDDIRVAAETAAVGAGLGGVSGALRSLIFGQVGGFGAYISIIAAACVVGAVFKLALSEWDIDGKPIAEGAQWAIVIVTSIVAKDMLAGLRAMGSEFAVDPLALVQRVWKAIRGQ